MMDRNDLAETPYRWAFEQCRQENGVQFLETLECAHNLGDILSLLDRFKEAEEMLRTALRGREVLLGKEHLYMLYIMQVPGSMLLSDARLKEAESILRRVILGRKTISGPTHSETLFWFNVLGSILVQ